MATEKILNTRYQLKVDTTAHWALATNFIPKKGEPIIYQDINETDNTQKIKIKIGDGTTTVINLPFTLEPIKKFTVSATSANSYTGVSFEEIAEAVAQQGTCFCELEGLSLILPLVQIEAGSFKFNLVHNQTEYTLVSYFDEEILTLNTSSLGSSNSTNYGVCATAASTTEKTVEIEGFELKKGVSVAIKFTFAVPANTTLNVSSTGAKNIYYKGTNIVSDIIQAGDLATFMYDGTQYHLLTIDKLTDNIKALEAKTQYFTLSTSEPNQLWFSGGSFTPNPSSNEEVNLGDNHYGWDKLFLSGGYNSGINVGLNLITCSELNCLSGVNTNIQEAIDNLNTIGNQFTLYTDENRLAFTGQNFTPLNSGKLSNLGDNYNYWNYIFLQGGIYTPSGLIEARNIDQLANLQENVQNKLILLTQGYNELANKIENGTGGGSSSNTSPKVMSIFKPFDTPEATLPYNVAYGQVGFDETNLTPWVYAPYTTYMVTWNGSYLNLNAGDNTVDSTIMPTLLSRGYNYLVDTSTDTIYSVFSATESADSSVNSGTTPNTGTVGTISTGNELSGDLSLEFDTTSTPRWYPTSGWDTSFLNTNTTYKLCIMEWQPFLQPAETSSF